MKKIQFLITYLLITFVWFGSSFASEALTTSKMADVYVKVEKLVQKYGPREVVVVFDIDNTLLASKQQLGSDQWFEWQAELIEKKSNTGAMVAKSFPELLDNWGMLLATGEMRLTDPETAKIVRKIQNMGSVNMRPKVFALTSRGPRFKDSTLKAFEANGIDMSASGIGPQEGFAHDWKAGDNKNTKVVSYTHGIFFTAGLNKGQMLQTILEKAKVAPKAIVFVDDKKKHTTHVQAAFKETTIDVVTFRYGREDPKVKEFVEGDKSKVSAKWKKLQKTFNDVFVR